MEYEIVKNPPMKRANNSTYSEWVEQLSKLGADEWMRLELDAKQSRSIRANFGTYVRSKGKRLKTVFDEGFLYLKLSER